VSVEVDRRALALIEDGVSYRQVAKTLGLSVPGVQRAVKRARVAAGVGAPGGGDPIISLLTSEDMAELGVSAADVAAGLNPLQRYRVMYLRPSAAGDAARELFDHGRGGEAWGAWVRANADAEPVRAAGGEVPAHVRDAELLELHKRGLSYKAIAERLGFSGPGAAFNALQRAKAGRPGR
jgi:DNA-binding CsgD family transcriptional regulator